MKRGRTLGFFAVCVGSLLATLTTVSANHFVAGGGRYTLPSARAETSVHFQFLGVASSVPGMFVPVIQTHIQCRVVHTGGSRPFRLLMSGTEVDPFRVKETPQEAHRITITGTITGTMRSHLVVGVGAERQRFTEMAPFTAVGVDRDIPGAGHDAFTLTLHYRARQNIGPLLFEALGADRVTCNADTCTLTVTGTLTDGEIEGHTSGGE